MELVDYTDADYELTVQLETDPDVMAELGGPLPLEAIPGVHERRLKAVAGGDWWFKIVPEPGGPDAGAIGIWPSTWRGAAIHEAGWMILPPLQGRGFAGRALAMLLRRASADPRYEAVHAFPGIDNAASNALCRRAGLELIEEDVEVDYAGRQLTCNHWRLRLRE